MPPAIVDALRGLAHVMVLLLEREHASHRSTLAGQAPHVSMAPVWQAGDNCSADEFENIIGDSPALRRAMFRVQQVAPTDASVMLLGETGTGKELFARAIHNRSVRSGKPFVKVNCAALPSTLIETELFGHVRGAFTGAVAMRQGRFEIADGGTLFLDEIGDLPADVQAKLLRVLQEGEFERVGSSQSRRVDVRIVAATHHDLDAAMTEGRFRADLYYRLNVFPIVLPPLRRAHRGHSAAGVVLRQPPPARAQSQVHDHPGLGLCVSAGAAVARQRPRAAERDRARDDPFNGQHAQPR